VRGRGNGPEFEGATGLGVLEFEVDGAGRSRVRMHKVGGLDEDVLAGGIGEDGGVDKGCLDVL
jgi:hypothetical protein